MANTRLWVLSFSACLGPVNVAYDIAIIPLAMIYNTQKYCIYFMEI